MAKLEDDPLVSGLSRRFAALSGPSVIILPRNLVISRRPPLRSQSAPATL
jgi:hypothetical protein